MNFLQKNYKKHLMFAMALMLGFATYAQKDELKKAEKALKGGDVTTAKNAVDQAEGMISSADAKLKAKFYFLKAKTYYEVGKKNPALDAEAYDKSAASLKQLMDFEKETGKAKYTEQAGPLLNEIINDVSTKGIKQYQDKEYAKAKDNLYKTFVLSPTDTAFLEYAANAAYLDKDFDLALGHFNKLKELDYTGISTTYSAMNKETTERENFADKSQMDLMVKTGQYTDAKAETSKSKRGDVIKNIALLLVEKGETDKAMAAVKEARAMYPDDLDLILVEGNVYLKLEDKAGFKKAMEEAIAKDPTNANLYFNVGVISQEQGNTEEALKNYDKAIELDPEYTDAYLNKGAALLDGDKALVEEMNANLSNFKKYDEIKAKQKELYKKVIPYYEKAYSLDTSNIEVVKTLMSIYENVDMEDKYKEMKAIWEASKE